MLPSKHILLGFLFSIILYIFFPNIGIIGMVVIFLSSFLIDLDHYLYGVYKTRKLSLRKVYLWNLRNFSKTKNLSLKERDKLWECFAFLHGIEFVLVLIFATIFIHKIFLFILIGVIFHLILDLLYQRKYMNRMDKVSILHDFLKYKKLKFIDG